MKYNLKIESKQRVDFVDITEKINQLLSEDKTKDGICTVFVRHTTAAIICGEAEDDLLADFINSLKLVPKSDYKHGHGDPNHVPAHILSSIIGQSITIPVSNGSLDLGTWQRVMLVELHGPKEREISIRIST